jgi:DNA-binding response OmpR family regulator
MSDYSPISILCVEDDKDTCDLIILILGQEGYLVLTAETMEKALSILQNKRISLSIVDGKLPDGNGTDLCRKIKEFDKSIPVIFYSAAARTTDIEEAMKAGADEYLTKPSGWDNLVETVNKQLESIKPDLISNQLTV